MRENELIKLYDPDTFGRWKIFGEDPNCDMGGHHENPYLETVDGTYKNVVKYALSLPRFIGWGSGGTIKKVQHISDIKNVDEL